MKKRLDTSLYCRDESRTKQSFAKQCDINHIMTKFTRTAGVDFLKKFSGYTGGQVGDFSKVVDYRSAIEQVRAAEGVFGALPARVRGRFLNDPAAFLDFCQNPANLDELISMGLVAPESVSPAQAEAKTL